MNIIKLALPAFTMFLTFAACNQTGQNSTESSKMDSGNVTESFAIELKDQNIDLAYDQYLKLKDVLVLSDSIKSQAAAKDLASTLSKSAGSETIAKLASDLASESSLSKQRTIFTSLSNELIILFKNTEITSGSMLVQYCPMANDGEGGYWLAAETEIKNPYYGDEMLNCGEVKETIEKK
jgi:hypothetical protein